jgi:hypothetical protein
VMTACTLMSRWVIISQRVAVRIHIPIQRLWGDHFAVDDERGAERLDARAGLRACPERSRRIGQGGRDDRPGAGDHRAVGRDGVADEGRLAVKLQAEESGPLGPVVDVIRRLGAQVVRHAGGHGRWVVGGGAGPGGGGGVRDGSAPVDVVAGHAAAAVAGAAPGEIRIVTRVLPYAVAGGAAGIDRSGIVRGSDIVFESKRVRPGREVAGVVLGAYLQVVDGLGGHGRRVVSGGRRPGGRKEKPDGVPKPIRFSSQR